MTHRIDQIIDAYIDQTIDDEGFATLCDWLGEDAAHRETFARKLAMHSAIAEWCTERTGGLLAEVPGAAEQQDQKASQTGDADPMSWIDQLSTLDRQDEQIERAGSSPLPARELTAVAGYVLGKALTSTAAYKAYALAAVLIIAVTLVLVFAGGDGPANNNRVTDQNQSGNQDDRPIVATLTDSHNAKWETQSQPAGDLRRGTLLHPGDRLTLTHGFAEITTARGAVAILESPATVELTDNDNAIRLHTGKLVGICETRSSKGFVVRTPHMDVIDLGTRFGVEVIQETLSEVHVFEGKVQVAVPTTGPGAVDPSAIGHVKQVTANRSVRIHQDRPQIVSIDPVAHRFSQALATERCRGTGFGLSEGAVATHWQVIADANGALKDPLPLVVQSSRDAFFPAIGNDPAVAQWLVIAQGETPLYPLPLPQGIDLSAMTYRGRFELSGSIGFKHKVLYLRYASGESIVGLRVNGQAIALPENLKTSFDPKQRRFHEIEIPVRDTALQIGDNRIDIEIDENFGTAASVFFYCELRPSLQRTARPRGRQNDP